MSDYMKPLPNAIEIARTAQTHDFVHPLESTKGTEWYVIFLDTFDPFVAPYAELEGMFKSAPNPFAKAWLRGIMDTREMISAVTGNPF